MSAVLIVGLAAPAWAADSWSTPFNGVRRLFRTAPGPLRIHAVFVDLCAAGVSVRATRESERGRTASSFGALVGAEIVVNGDFFGSGYLTTGMAMGQGDQWRNDSRGQGFVAFGPYQSDISPPAELVSAAPPWMQQVVGGRPQVLADGKVVANGSTLCTARHPRTAVGLSEDRRTLILAVVDGRSGASIGVTCDQLGAVMRDLGAHDALNLDGGGSSTMWQRGLGVVNTPSDPGNTQRVVANHIAIQADGSGQPRQCPLPREEVLFLGGVVSSGGTSDIDGDGQQDVCARAAAGIRCSLSTGDGLTRAVSGPELSNAYGWDDADNGSTLRMGDIDGDDRADLCARANAGVLCWLSTGSGFERIAGPELSNAGGWNGLAYYSTMQLADIDGDGKDDLCVRAAAGMRCYKSTGTGFEGAIDGPPLSDADGWANIARYGTIRYGDVDGDGRADVCARGATGMRCWLSDGSGFPTEVVGPEWSDAVGWEWVQYWSTIRLADVTGDGRADLCARSASDFRCYPSEGSSFGAPIAGPELSNASGWGDYSNYSTIRMADLDGDGRVDLCARADAGLRCWLSTGTGFGAPIDGPRLADGAGWDADRYHRTLRLGDVDGDGSADVCARSSRGFACWLWNGNGFDADPISGPEWSDATGWGDEIYYSSIRAGGPICRPRMPACNGRDDNCDGIVDDGCPADDDGDVSEDGDVDDDDPNSGSDAGDDQVSGCQLGQSGAGGLAPLLLVLGLLAARGRRRTR